MKKTILVTKKAISPLIATVLLIAFVIALGAVIMNWSKTYTEEEMGSSRTEYYAVKECERYVGLEIKEIDGKPKLCYNLTGTTLNIDFMLENTGTKTIEGVRVVAIGADDSVNSTGSNFLIENTSIKLGGILKNVTTFTVSSTFGSLAQVEFISFLNTTGAVEKTLCSKKSLVKTGSDITTC